MGERERERELEMAKQKEIGSQPAKKTTSATTTLAAVALTSFYEVLLHD